MSLRNWTPCDEPDMDGRHHCPYADDGDYVNCEWYCGAEEPQDDPEIWEEDEEEEYWNPYETSEDSWEEWDDPDWDEDIEDDFDDLDTAVLLILMVDE